MKYTLTFDEQALNVILTGLAELPAKMSRELMNGIIQAKNDIEKQADEAKMKVLPDTEPEN